MNARLNRGENAPDFAFETPWNGDGGFYEAAGEKPAVLVFSRYLGCPISQMGMDDLRKGIDRLQSKGAEVFLITQSPASTIAAASKQEDWPYQIVCDPDETIYELYAVAAAASTAKMLHPGLLPAVVKMVSKGYKHGAYEGTETQLPAAFVVGPDKSILLARYGKHPADVPTPAALARVLR